MNFDYFITKYYSTDKLSEIINCLNKLSIYNEVECILNRFYQVAGDGNKTEIITQFAITCEELATSIQIALDETCPGLEKRKTEQKIKDFIVYLITDTYHHSGLCIQEYFDLLRQTVGKTHPQNSFDFSVMEKLLSFSNKEAIGMAEPEKKHVNGIKPVKLHWQGEKQLDFFIDDLIKTFQGIKCKRQLYLLFDAADTDFKIELKSKYLIPFLTLFHELHESGKIKVIGNRGLYVYLHQHLQPPQNDSYPKRDFRKLRYEAIQNERSKNEILRIISTLLNKYMCNEQLYYKSTTAVR